MRNTNGSYLSIRPLQNNENPGTEHIVYFLREASSQRERDKVANHACLIPSPTSDMLAKDPKEGSSEKYPPSSYTHFPEVLQQDCYFTNKIEKTSSWLTWNLAYLLLHFLLGFRNFTTHLDPPLPNASSPLPDFLVPRNSLTGPPPHPCVVTGFGCQISASPHCSVSLPHYQISTSMKLLQRCYLHLNTVKYGKCLNF